MHPHVVQGFFVCKCNVQIARNDEIFLPSDAVILST
ncbi:hypothetical protein SAMN05421545_1855 [Pontibacter lucknowensis]|uniref:Uncharacterized protein n=1 Tax=Pontibacter lucknowensis TaxID=1077936 RepID=A0A1N6X0C4_9BACT|nr:hypothetical protein SAMN05421545_1855 [Pontibacter lucknowensis]